MQTRRRLAMPYEPYHQPVPIGHLGKLEFSWGAFLDQVDRDITLAENFDRFKERER